MTKRRPWFKFHTQDWRADPNLRMCSPGARGMWADMLSLMHEATPYGFLVVGGKPPTDEQLSRLLSIDLTLIAPLIGELEANSVFSRADDGVIFSRRMVRDAEQSDAGRDNIAKRWGNDAKSRGITSAPIRTPNRVAEEKNGADPNTKSQSQSVVAADVRGDAQAWQGRLEEAKVRAAGACNLTNGNIHHVADLKRLVTIDGCDWDEDVLPAIDCLTAAFKAKSRLFHSWQIVGETACANRDRRLRPATPINLEAERPRRSGEQESRVTTMKRMMAEGRI